LATTIFNILVNKFDVWNVTIKKYQLKKIVFPTALNDAVENTTNKKNQLPAEENNLRNTKLEMEGKTSLAEGDKDAIIRNATSIINKSKSKFYQNIFVDNDYILKNSAIIEDFIIKTNISSAADKQKALFKLLYING